MKNLLLPALALTVLTPCVTTLQAQTPAPEPSLNHFSFSYRMAFNLGVKFKNLGGFTSSANPGPATGGTENRTYDDGYNLVDNNNNSYGDLQATRNWGYNDAGQVQNGQFIVMHSSSSAAAAATPSRDSAPEHGFELTYQRELGRKENWRWGVEGAFNYMTVCLTDRAALTAPVTRINDAFEVPADESGFRFIPTAPYAGNNSAGALLGSSPTRTTTIIPNGAAITGSRSFDADLFGFKAGLYLDYPLDEKWRVTLSGGLALVEVASEFSNTEVVTIAGVGAQARTGAGSYDDLLVGGYLTGNIFYTINPEWELFGGVQFQSVGKYTHALNGPVAELDLSKTLFVTIGANWSF